MTKGITAEFLHGILEGEAVTQAAAQVANPSEAHARAHEALQLAVELAENAEHDISEAALTDIAIKAVLTLTLDQERYALHHCFNGWLGGPSVVPTDLRFSWEPGPKPKKGDKAGSTPIPEITPERGAELLAAQNTMTAVDAAVLDVADLYKAMGRIEMGHFLQQVQDVVIAKSFVQIKSDKKYKHLTYRDESGNVKRFQTLEKFCERTFGKSYRRINELANNLHTLGADLYEAAEAVGFKARDYQALKALPAEEQEVVKQALAADSKDQVLDILQDLAARHQSERAAAKKKTEDLEADLEARDKLLTDKSEKLDKVSLDLEKLKSLPPNKRARLQLEQEQAAALRINAACVKAEGEINLHLAEVADVLALDELSQTTTAHAMNSVRFLCESLSEFLAAHNIDVDFAGMARPEWRRDLAAQDLGVKESAE
jgi:hypothetical protein